jgi:hypothetical protein
MAETARAKGGARMNNKLYRIDYIIYNNKDFTKTIYAFKLEEAEEKKDFT